MGLFGKKKQTGTSAPSQAEGKQNAPGTGIAYDKSLITRFKGHHQSLLKLFNGITEAAEQHNYDLLSERLKKFLRTLEMHVLEENLRFYVYLSKCMEGNDDLELVLDMKKEMSKISRDVRSFILHHIEHGVTEDNIAKFQGELKAIGETLIDRIEREESSLYTLYLPPDNY